MTPPSLNMLSPSDQAALVQSCEQGVDVAISGDSAAFVRWLDMAPVPVVQYLSTYLMQAKEGLSVRRIDGQLWNREVFPRIPDRTRPIALVRANDPEALRAWMAEQDHPCRSESVLRLALREGRHQHLSVLLRGTQCVNPDMLVRVAWQAERAVPLAWALHWFEQLSPEQQQNSVDDCFKGCISQRRAEWLGALIDHQRQLSSPLNVAWPTHVNETLAARWVAGMARLALEPNVQKVVLETMEGAVKDGRQEEANWLMSRLPTAVRSAQLETWATQRPGLFAEAQQQHEAEERQRAAQELAPTRSRRRRHS